jgi:hypothetical protein
MRLIMVASCQEEMPKARKNDNVLNEEMMLQMPLFYARRDYRDEKT